MIFYLFICGFDIYCDFFFPGLRRLGLLCIFSKLYEAWSGISFAFICINRSGASSLHMNF